MELVTEL